MIGAVVFKVLYSVAVEIDSFVFASITETVAVGIFLIGVGIPAVVAGVADTVVVCIILNGLTVCITDDVAVGILVRVVVIGAVVFKVLYSVAVEINSFVFACITETVAVGVFLVTIGIPAVVACVADTVVVCIILNRFSVFITDDVAGSIFVRVLYKRAVVLEVLYSVAVKIYCARITRHRILVSVGVSRAVVAGVADTVVVCIILNGLTVFITDDVAVVVFV